MIVISGALVVIALVLLIIGVVSDILGLVYGSIAVSLLALVFLGIGILQRRGETAPAAGEGVGQPARLEPEPQAVDESRPSAAVAHDEPVDAVEDGDDGEVEYGGAVLVVEGRPRYHVEGCRYLSGKQPDTVDALDARDEGFTPCGVCKPDEVLEAEYQAEYGDAQLSSGDDVADATSGVDADGESPDDEDADEQQDSDAAAGRRSTAARTASAKTASAKTAPAKTAAAKTAAAKATAAKATAAKTTAAKTAAVSSTRASAAPAKTGPARTGPAKTGPASTGPAKTTAAKTSPAKKAAGRSGPKTVAAGTGRTVTASGKSGRTAAPASKTSSAASAAKKPGSVVVIPDRGRFHRSECRYVRDGQNAETMSRSAASREGYEPCGVCKP